MSDKIQEFVGALTDNEIDILSQVLTDLQDSSAKERIGKLSQFLQQLNTEIDQINRRRDSLGVKVRSLTDFVKILDEYMKKRGQSLELMLLKNFCVEWRAELKKEIEDSRPAAKLEKKYEVERKLDSLSLIQDLIPLLGQEIQAVRNQKGASALMNSEIVSGVLVGSK